MDAFMRKIERLAAMAAARSVPLPLDADVVMMRLTGLEIEDDRRVLSLPLRFWAGGVAAAAAAAVVVSFLAATAWAEMDSPLLAIQSLVEADVMDIL